MNSINISIYYSHRKAAIIKDWPDQFCRERVRCIKFKLCTRLARSVPFARFCRTTIMPKRRRADCDNEVETITFSIPEDNSPLPSSSTITPTPTMILSPPSSKQVFNVSEWTVETDRVSTSNTLFSSMVEPAPGMSFRESGHDLHIPGAYDNYYDVIDVSDFQPPPEPLQPSRSSNTESSKTSIVRLFSPFTYFYLI